MQQVQSGLVGHAICMYMYVYVCICILVMATRGVLGVLTSKSGVHVCICMLATMNRPGGLRMWAEAKFLLFLNVG